MSRHSDDISPKQEPEARGAISRRSLLAASAGLTLASLTLSKEALAQDHAMAGQPTGSARIYPINEFNGVSDIAHDPADIPPPTRFLRKV